MQASRVYQVCGRRIESLHGTWRGSAMRRGWLRQVGSVFDKILCQAWRGKEVLTSRLRESCSRTDSLLRSTRRRCALQAGRVQPGGNRQDAVMPCSWWVLFSLEEEQGHYDCSCACTSPAVQDAGIATRNHAFCGSSKYCCRLQHGKRVNSTLLEPLPARS